MTVAVSTVELARTQFAMTSLYHFLFVPLTLGLAPLVAVMQTLWYRSGDEALAAADSLLRDADAHQLRDRRRDRARPGVPVRHELVGLLGVRRRRLRRAARHRGARRLHARVDVPRPLDLRLGPALAPRAPRDGLALCARHLAVRALHHRRQLVDAAPGRLGRRRRSRRADELLGAHTNRLALWAYGHVVFVGITTAAAVSSALPAGTSCAAETRISSGARRSSR